MSRITANHTNENEKSKSGHQKISRKDISRQIPHPPPGLPLEGEGNILSDVLITDILATNILIS
jgi:hypothetical protein